MSSDHDDHDHHDDLKLIDSEQHSALKGHVDGAGEAVLLPDDAGSHAAALGAILRRIPPRWGRWIDTGPGWYPLIVDTDTRLAALDPDYVVHQIKQKYGALRYHCTPSGDNPNPELLDAFDAITDDAEHISSRTCEQCGEPGTLWTTRCRVNVRCSSCAEPFGHPRAQ